MHRTSFEFRTHTVNLVRFATHVRAYVAYRCDYCLQHHQRFSGCVTVRELVRVSPSAHTEPCLLLALYWNEPVSRGGFDPDATTVQFLYKVLTMCA